MLTAAAWLRSRLSLAAVLSEPITSLGPSRIVSALINVPGELSRSQLPASPQLTSNVSVFKNLPLRLKCKKGQKAPGFSPLSHQYFQVL